MTSGNSEIRSIIGYVLLRLNQSRRQGNRPAFWCRLSNPESFQPVYSTSGFCCPELPVITDENPSKISHLRWGLIPSWTKDIESAMRFSQQTLNSRAETIFDKPMFRNLIISKRCLVIVNGFFDGDTKVRKNTLISSD